MVSTLVPFPSKLASTFFPFPYKGKVGMGMGSMHHDTQRAGVGMGKLRHNDVRDIEAVRESIWLALRERGAPSRSRLSS